MRFENPSYESLSRVFQIGLDNRCITYLQ